MPQKNFVYPSSLQRMAETMSHKAIGETLGVSSSSISKALMTERATRIVENAARWWLQSNDVTSAQYLVTTADPETFELLAPKLHLTIRRL